MSEACKCLYNKLKKFSDHTGISSKYCELFAEIHYFAIKILAITIQKKSIKSGIVSKNICLKESQVRKIFDLSFFFLQTLEM